MDITSAVSVQAKGAAGEVASAATSRPSAVSQLDSGAFLKILIAQMTNQDPLEPMKSSDYVAQLATFTQVEKSVEMNSRLADLLSAVQLQQAGSLIGKSVTSVDGLVSGTVVAAKIESGNLVAVLKDGREVAMGPGIMVSGVDS